MFGLKEQSMSDIGMWIIMVLMLVGFPVIVIGGDVC